MSEPIPTNPTPTAVPWTPEMVTPQQASPAQAPVQPFDTPQYQPPQAHPAHGSPAQAGLAQGHPSQPQYQPHLQPAQSFPSQPQFQPHPPAQPQMQQPQYMPDGQAQPHTAMQSAQPHYAPGSQFVQPGPPPLAPHMQASPQAQDAPRESKSLFAKLLKRSPKPQVSDKNSADAAESDSLFNKNFLLGAITGLVIGAFILPMALNMISGDAPAQTQTQAGLPPTLDIAPSTVEGETFIDNAIAADAP